MLKKNIPPIKEKKTTIEATDELSDKDLERVIGGTNIPDFINPEDYQKWFQQYLSQMVGEVKK